MGIRIIADLEGLTYGNLFEFVDAARAAGVDPAQEVKQVPYEQSDEDAVERFELSVESLSTRNFTNDLDGLDREELVSTLDVILDSGGDARHVLDILGNLRDRLV